MNIIHKMLENNLQAIRLIYITSILCFMLMCGKSRMVVSLAKGNIHLKPSLSNLLSLVGSRFLLP